MKTILAILENAGFIDSLQLREVAATFPRAQVVVKWERSRRSVGAAEDILRAIEFNQKNEIDFAREVFFSCESYDKLCAVLGVKTISAIGA